MQNFLTCFEMVLASIAHTYAFGHQEYQQLDSARLPWPYALRDAASVKDLQMEISHTWRGTQFRGYNDLLGSGSSRPLLNNNDSYLRLNTALEFSDVDAEDEEYQIAKEIGDDYNYRVISPKSVASPASPRSP